MQLRWSHAFVLVENMEAMLDFYTDVLGFEVTDQGEIGGRRATFMSQVETDHHQIAFLEQPSTGPETGETGVSSKIGHFAFRAPSLGEVKTLHARLQADDRVANVSPVSHGNAWSVYFADPEGNGIEVFCDTPWHVQQPQGGSWDPAASDEDVINTTRQQFEDANGFGPIENYYRQRAEHLARR